MRSDADVGQSGLRSPLEFIPEVLYQVKVGE